MPARPVFKPYIAEAVTGEVWRWAGARSRHVEHARDILVWLPPGYHAQPERRFPVLYLHDGQNKLDPKTSYTGRDWDVDTAATALIERGEIEPLIMVAIYNSPDRLHEYNPLDRGHAYAAFIITEVMPVIDSAFRTERGRRNALMGSSMGGLISLAMLWKRPDVFFGAACLSPSLWVLARSGGAAAWLEKHPAPPSDSRLYLDHGTRGAEARVRGLAEEVAAFAVRAGLKKTRVRHVVARGGEHNEVSWRARVDKPLKHLFGRPKPRRGLPRGASGWTVRRP
jgi:predicted alpha/beta superfamily hydrolase